MAMGYKMKIRYGIIFIFLSLLLLGCPLDSKFPLGDSRSAKIDERYIGKWVVTELGLSSKETMRVLLFNENEYYIETRVINEEHAGRFRAYITVIDNVQILNVQDIEENKSKREYSFLKVSLGADNILTLWVLESNRWNHEFNSKEELYQYVQSNINNDELYKKLTSFKRQVQ